MNVNVSASQISRILSTNDTSATGATPLPTVTYETSSELHSSIILGIAFFLTMLVALKRVLWSCSHREEENTVVTAFYCSILITSALRAIWLLIPDAVLRDSFTPSAIMAFIHPQWVGTFFNDLLQCLGSISFFSIFILILTLWSSILEKYYHPDAVPDIPLKKFFYIMTYLLLFEALNCVGFLLQVYSSECMILVNAVFVAVVSVICVIFTTFYSRRFRTVLKTLGVVNQVSTDGQIQRIMWITWTGTLFFTFRAITETIFTGTLISFFLRNGKIDEAFNDSMWSDYVFVTHWAELAILVLMLFILHNRFTNARNNYREVPETPENPKSPNVSSEV